MKQVDIDELGKRLLLALLGGEPLEICHEGQALGVFIPTRTSPEGKAEAAQALERLGKTVQQVLEETGLTEEELAQVFDYKAPFPSLPKRRSKPAPAHTVAPGC